MAGKITLPHTCPNCKKTTAKTHQELIDKFGLRNINNVYTTNQSWCRECRKKS